MYDCQVCFNTPIPEKTYELLDWKAASDKELIICPKCLQALLKNKEATIEIKLQKKSAVLAVVVWTNDTETDVN